jgi:hypothetical protein
VNNIKNKTVLALSCLSGLVAGSVAEATQSTGVVFTGEEVYPAVVTVNLKTAAKPHRWQPGDPIKEIPFRFNRPKDWVRPDANQRGFGLDPLADKQIKAFSDSQLGGTPPFGNQLVNVDGLDFTGVNPSDTNGDVGIDYYIQSINNGSSSGILIIDKDTGAVEVEFVLDAIANGTGTGCGGGTGDPVIMFDQLVDNGPGEPDGRWVLTEFTNSSLCLYISQTASPIGPQDTSTWYVYEFTSASGGLPDYPKFGVWPDAYYVGANESNRQYAFDRVNMVQGLPARPYQVFQSPGLPGFGFQHMMPADTDGADAPPAGAPGIFMRHRDAEYHGDGPGADDVLELWELAIDWDTPGNSAITGPTNIPVSEFDTNLGGTNFGDLSVPQPSGTNLFPLKQPLMWRVQHRTYDGKQYLIGNMVTDVDGNDFHGVRWWVLERPAATTSGGWTLSDEGTYTLGDGVHRWMASVAMDGSGNLALGYNVSARNGLNGATADVFPGMRYAGRLFDDPAGTMTRGEYSIIEGSGSNGSGRYGDYSSMSVDPVDDCTFWYTAQYNPTSQWNTRVVSFKFEACGCLLAIDPVTMTSASANMDNNIRIQWNDAPNAEITEYRIYRSTTSGSGYVLIDTVTDTSPGSANTGTYTYDDGTVSGGLEYFYVVRSSDGEACNSDVSNELSATATGICTLAPQFNGITSAANDATNTCGVTVDWGAGVTSCPSGSGNLSYNVYRSTTSGFDPGSMLPIASGITGTSFNDDISLVSDQDYFYVVRAVEVDTGSEDSNTLEMSARPTGSITPTVFDENLNGYANMADAEAGGWSHFADTGSDDWRIEIGDDNPSGPGSGSGSAFVSTDVDTTTDKSLVTEPFSPTGTSVLSFYHKHQFETNGAGTTFYDGAVLEISADGGSNWSDLGNAMTTGGYNATLNGGFGQPLGAVPAWGGDLASYTLVEVDLSAYAGQLVNVRWRMGTDSSVNDGDWKIDDISISDVGIFGVCTTGNDVIFYDGFNVQVP